MMEIKEIVHKYKSAEQDKTFPFSEWHRKDVFERLVKPFLVIIGYNPDQINYDNTKGIVELKLREDLKAIVYLSSIQEEQRFLSSKISAPIDTIPDPKTSKPEYEIAVITNFEKWFFYFDGEEIYAIGGERVEEEVTKIDRLVYNLYGLTEDEIKVVEKSVWGENFEEMYGKLPPLGNAIELSKICGFKR